MSTFSSKDIETIIARAVRGARGRILEYKLEPFAADKGGILGEHCLLSVKFENQEDINKSVKVYKFFVKLLGDIKELPSFLDVDIFEEEINFYNEIQPLMLENYNGEKWCPECYLAKSGVLVLEDLRERGFSARPEPAMDDNALKSAVTVLARFHACSVMAEAKLGKPLNEAFSKYFSEKMYSDSNKFGQAVKLGYRTIALIAEKLNLDASFLLPNIYNYVSQMVRPSKQELNVVCHTDLYKYNILFNSDSSAIILDYQLLRYASPLIDFSILLHLNTTPEFRKKSDINILKHYYKVFQGTLDQSGFRISIPSCDDIIEKYKKYKIVGMAMSVDYLAALNLNPDIRFKIWNHSETLQKYLLHNRIDILGPQLEIDLEYATKMKDILSEYLIEARRILGL